MSLARVMNALSTLMLFFALVSMNLMLYSSASFWPSAVSTTFQIVSTGHNWPSCAKSMAAKTRGAYLLVHHVALVADQHLVHRLSRVLLDVPDPVPDVAERLVVGDVVHQQDAHSSTVVGSGDSPESLLSSCVPNLQLDTLAIKLNCANLEIDANRSDEALRERVVGESKQETALSHTAVSNEEELDQVVVGGLSTSTRRGRHCMII
mmetsp:Transcript_11611/g.46911  ORF Transcript_11611/g.46911 Transcript_11611/m.46911 type:complete len:207 (-) Transcript_11611:180-800(-)